MGGAESEMGERLGPYLLGPNDENQGVHTGDARALAPAIPDGSIDLIFTDPIYQNIDDYRWLAETAARVLKPGGRLITYFAEMYLPQTLTAMMVDDLNYCWLISERNLGVKGTIWKYRIKTGCKFLLWFFKPPFQFRGWATDFMWSLPDGGSVNHTWGKNSAAVPEIITRHSIPDDIIVDFFAGGGCIPAACKFLGRHYWASEIEPERAGQARQRIRQTQPPLFVVKPQQMAMEGI